MEPTALGIVVYGLIAVAVIIFAIKLFVAEAPHRKTGVNDWYSMYSVYTGYGYEQRKGWRQ